MFVTLLITEIFWALFRQRVLGIAFIHDLPLHISDLATMVILAALAVPKRFLCALAFFIGCFSGLFSTALPGITESGWALYLAIPRFFLTHGIMLGAGFYLTLGRRNLPQRLDLYLSYGLVVFYALLLMPLNARFNSNYFFVSQQPPHFPVFLADLSLEAYRTGFFAVIFLIFYFEWLALRWLTSHVDLRSQPDH